MESCPATCNMPRRWPTFDAMLGSPQVLIAVVILLGGCKVYDPLYCDDKVQCTDSARPFCDLKGEYPASEGVAKTCIPNPFDAGAGTLRDAGNVDGAVVRDAASRCSWGRLAPLAHLNTRDNEHLGSLSPDALTLYFSRYNESGDASIYFSRRENTSETFGDPVLIEEFDTTTVKFGPEVSASGLEAFYPINLGGSIETAIRRSSDGMFGPPSPTGLTGVSPALSGDELALYVVQFDGPGGPPKRATRSFRGGPWTGPVAVLPSGGYNSVDVSPDERRLLLTSQDDTSPILIAERESPSDEFLSPVPLEMDLLVPDAGNYLMAAWDADQTHMVVSVGLYGWGLELYYSVCN